MKFKVINKEVLYALDNFTNVNGGDIELLKDKASMNPRKRIRFCAHKGTDDTLHEMLIIHSKGAYVRPHKHLNKSESFHIIEGHLKVVIFNEVGGIDKVINMGDYTSGNIFFYRLTDECFHTVIPISDVVIFHETTNGPFCREDTVFASWAPTEDDDYEVQEAFLDKLK